MMYVPAIRASQADTQHFFNCTSCGREAKWHGVYGLWVWFVHSTQLAKSILGYLYICAICQIKVGIVNYTLDVHVVEVQRHNTASASS